MTLNFRRIESAGQAFRIDVNVGGTRKYCVYFHKTNGLVLEETVNGTAKPLWRIAPTS